MTDWPSSEDLPHDAPLVAQMTVRAHQAFLAGEVLATSVILGTVEHPTLTAAITGNTEVRVQIDPA